MTRDREISIGKEKGTLFSGIVSVMYQVPITINEACLPEARLNDWVGEMIHSSDKWTIPQIDSFTTYVWVDGLTLGFVNGLFIRQLLG